MEENSKVILVTGASRGIGRAIAEKFLNSGNIVYGTYKSSEKPMKELEKKYGKDKFKICGPYDFSVIEQIDEFVTSISGVEFDSLVLNAGMFSDNDDFLDFNLEKFNEAMNCNFYFPLIISIKLQNYIKNGGSIVLMSSNDAYSGAFSSLSYTISKNAVISLMKCLCVNFGRRRIRVNSVAPGAINTDMNTVEQEFEAPNWTPIERIAQPYEVAEVVYFLTSFGSSFINGENITIDGGYSQVSALLKKEAENSRQIVGYDWLNKKMQSLTKGDIAYCFDTTPDYGWIDNIDEKEYILLNIESQNRGAIVHRLISANNKKMDSILSNNLINYSFDNYLPNNYICIIEEEELKQKRPNEFLKIGKGFIIFENHDGTKEIFIDSFSDNKNVGYLVNSYRITESLIEAYFNILNDIKNEKIHTVRQKNLLKK